MFADLVDILFLYNISFCKVRFNTDLVTVLLIMKNKAITTLFFKHQQ